LCRWLFGESDWQRLIIRLHDNADAAVLIEGVERYGETDDKGALGLHAYAQTKAATMN
jgi:hypothetical protein